MSSSGETSGFHTLTVVNEMSKQLATLEKDVASLRGASQKLASTGEKNEAAVLAVVDELEELRGQLRNLNSQVTFALTQQRRFQRIELDPYKPGFQRLDTDLGTFLISCRNVVPFLGGFKLLLDIGNPSSAQFNGIAINVRWGRKFKDEDLPDDPASAVRKWSDSLRKKTERLTTVLRPGRWNRAELTLPGKKDELGYIELSIETDNVTLIQAPAH